MRSFTGLDLCLKLLSGAISSAQLEAALSDPLYLGPWRELMIATELNALLNNPTALNVIFGSPTAFGGLLDRAGHVLAASDVSTEIISNNSNAILTVVSNADYLDYWNSVPANKSRLQARVNAPGSKIKAHNFTTVGTHTLTLPAGYKAVQSLLVGAGGKGSYGDQYFSGGSNYQVSSGPGGGGGEVKTRAFYGEDLPPPGDITITIGVNANTTFGGYLTAIKGGNATGGDGTQSSFTNPIAGIGGGTDSNQSEIYTDVANEVWQPATASKKGGYGGGSVGTSWISGAPIGNGQAGGHGITGTGGGTAGASSNPGGPGTSIGAGGGSSGYYGFNTGAASATATVPGAASGGMCQQSGSTGNGAPGAAYIRVIEG